MSWNGRWRSRFRPGGTGPQEAGVFALVVPRMLNKQAAGELGIVEKRSQCIEPGSGRTMRAGSLTERVQLADQAGGYHRGHVLSVSALASGIATDGVGPRSHIARSPARYDALGAQRRSPDLHR